MKVEKLEMDLKKIAYEMDRKQNVFKNNKMKGGVADELNG